MCGIAGASLNPNDQANMKNIAKAMLLAIEHRGYDATGFAFRDSTGTMQVHKDDLPASLFVKRRLCMPKSAKTFIAHTRFATQGHQMFNVNNHPIATAGIVGVHNGHVNNDDQLFSKIDCHLDVPLRESVRIGEVDSEAIFALIGFMDSERKPEKLLELVRGGAAVAWMDDADERNILHLARLNSSPLVIVETHSGSLFFASTEEAALAGANAARLTVAMIRHIQEGQYMEVLDGDYTAVRSFAPAKWYTSPVTTRGITDRMKSVNKDWADDEDWFDPSSHKNATHDERTYAYIMGKQATVTSLTDRLAQEEPDISDAPGELDDDTWNSMTPEERISYEEWWTLNAALCDDAIADDDEAEKARKLNHQHFHEYLDAPSLNSYYLSNIEYPVEIPRRQDYLAVPSYAKRDATVDDWMSCLKSSPDNRVKAAVNLKADAIPGMGVTTDIDGLEVFGHLVSLPETFPAGDYIIRAYVPRPKRKLGFEAVFIARKYFEFDITNEGTQDVPRKGTELVKVNGVLADGTELPAQQAQVKV